MTVIRIDSTDPTLYVIVDADGTTAVLHTHGFQQVFDGPPWSFVVVEKDRRRVKFEDVSTVSGRALARRAAETAARNEMQRLIDYRNDPPIAGGRPRGD